MSGYYYSMETQTYDFSNKKEHAYQIVSTVTSCEHIDGSVFFMLLGQIFRTFM